MFMIRRLRLPNRPALVGITLLLATLVLSGCAGDGAALLNVLDYRLRKAFPPLLVGVEATPGALSGRIVDQEGRPVAGAVVLVSTARGEVFQARSDAAGTYRVGGIKPGRYVPLAGAWGYDEVTQPAVRVEAGGAVDGVDFVLPRHRPVPVNPTDLQIGAPVESFSQFPEPNIAVRYPFTFTHDGFTIDGGQIYLPPQFDAAQMPTLVIIYPSRPLNWDAASVSLTQSGLAVLALGVDPDRGLDIDGHVRDFRAALQLWQQGQLTPLSLPDRRWIAASGSFGSLILFRALRDLDTLPPAILDIGGVSDAFLGVQSLYGEGGGPAIPPPYDMAVAAVGRPDRDPAFFFAYSPVFFADRLPPTFIIHMVNDEVIPHNQAEALAAAMAQSGAPHDLLLYEATTHYLDPRTPTEDTFMVYDRVTEFVERMVGGTQ